MCSYHSPSLCSPALWLTGPSSLTWRWSCDTRRRERWSQVNMMCNMCRNYHREKIKSNFNDISDPSLRNCRGFCCVHHVTPGSTLLPITLRSVGETLRGGVQSLQGCVKLNSPEETIFCWFLMHPETRSDIAQCWGCTLENGVYMNTWDQKWVLKQCVSGTSGTCKVRTHNNTAVRPLHRMVPHMLR